MFISLYGMITALLVCFFCCLDYLSNPPKLSDFIENVATEIPAKWRQVGIMLGLKSNKLDGIGARCRESQQECYEAIFQKWENGQEQPSWQRIIEVLQTKTVNANSLAKELSKRLR